jgi:GT2 family glycosyltransferase
VNPRVTVSIPTFNRSGMLHEALGSVLSQSFDDIEVIVSDNASTHETITCACPARSAPFLPQRKRFRGPRASRSVTFRNRMKRAGPVASLTAAVFHRGWA